MLFIELETMPTMGCCDLLIELNSVALCFLLVLGMIVWLKEAVWFFCVDWSFSRLAADCFDCIFCWL